MSQRDRNYNLRSNMTTAPPANGYQDSSQFRPPSASNSSSAQFDTRANACVATLDSLLPMLDSLKPETDFQIGISNYLRLLTAQVREIKVDLNELRSEQLKVKDELYFSNRAYVQTFDELKLSSVKNEQYTRRDTISVLGLAMPSQESQADLCTKVAHALSQSGETVSPADLSAVHRNSKDSKEIHGKMVPPSVTVRFATVNKKDNILKSYRNYDTSKKQRRSVTIYQSLSQHYAELRR